MEKSSLKGKTVIITGASRGIGKAIALRLAKEGANLVILAKTKDPHPKLSGTIFTAAEEIVKAGGKCLPCIVDIRFEEQVKAAIEQAVQKFGGVDILINNASALFLGGTKDTPIKKFDLLFSVNVRATFVCSQLCAPFLKKSENPHILNISPPLQLKAEWFSQNLAYAISKYGMSECVLGMSAEFKDLGIAVNALWPKTLIATAAVKHLGGDELIRRSRKPEIMADAACSILTKSSQKITGQFFIDEELLRSEGITNFDSYRADPSEEPMLDLFIE